MISGNLKLIGMSSFPKKENELYAPLKKYLESQAYEVKGEIRSCDVVALRGQEAPLIFELKLRLNLELLLQGVDRLSLSEQVYLVFPLNAGKERSLFEKKKATWLALCRRVGLGLIGIHYSKSTEKADREPLVEVYCDPTPYKPRQDKKGRARLLREFQKRRGDTKAGGSAAGQLMTAYRQDALLIAGSLLGAPLSPKSIRLLTGVDSASAILQRDVYGWFKRVERGIYELSDLGRATAEDTRSTWEAWLLQSAE